jgi:hypothetical protein
MYNIYILFPYLSVNDPIIGPKIGAIRYGVVRIIDACSS